MENLIWVVLGLGITFIACIVLMVFQNRQSKALKEETRTRMLEMMGQFNELNGKLSQMSASEAQRLDQLQNNITNNLSQTTQRSTSALGELHTKLALINEAQGRMEKLSSQVSDLQSVFTNKQARGALGEVQLKDLVTQALPSSAYKFQAKIGEEGKIADCVIDWAHPPGPLAIDSKFPLENYQAMVNAKDEETHKQARKAFANDLKKHIKDIASKYIIEGHTADSALLFLPSEAVYAEIHSNFRDIVEGAFRYRVWIVCPSTLMATLTTIRGILRDVAMREQAHIIQDEVRELLKDISRLDERTQKLQTHFDQASRDLRDIGVSTDKITKRGQKIEAVELEEQAVTPPLTGDNIRQIPRPSLITTDLPPSRNAQA